MSLPGLPVPAMLKNAVRSLTRDAQALLLATRESRTRAVEAILDLVPEVRALQRLLDEVVCVGL